MPSTSLSFKKIYILENIEFMIFKFQEARKKALVKANNSETNGDAVKFEVKSNKLSVETEKKVEDEEVEEALLNRDSEETEIK